MALTNWEDPWVVSWMDQNRAKFGEDGWGLMMAAKSAFEDKERAEVAAAGGQVVPQEVRDYFQSYKPGTGTTPLYTDAQGYQWGALGEGGGIWGASQSDQPGNFDQFLRSDEPGRQFNEVGSLSSYFDSSSGKFTSQQKSQRSATWGELIAQLAASVVGIGAVGAAAGVPLGYGGAAGAGTAGAAGSGGSWMTGVSGEALAGSEVAGMSGGAAGAGGAGGAGWMAGVDGAAVAGGGGAGASAPIFSTGGAAGGFGGAGSGNWLTSALGGSGGGGGGMAFSWTDLIGPALNFAGQAYAGKQAGDAGDDLAQAAREAAALYEPWRNAGSWAIGQSANMLGKSGPEAAKAAFLQDPGYQWRVSQGENGLTRARAAQGLLGSGKYLKDAMNYNQGQASQEFGNAFNRLQAVAGMGQTATNGAAGYNTDAASAAAAGKIAQGNALTNGIGQGWSMYQNSQQQNQNNALMQQFLRG